jgi:hypothetical protein
MLILDTIGGAIVPVRAIPYVTGDAITPREVAVAIADGREAPEQRVFETWLAPGYVDAAGDLHPMQYGDLQGCADAVNRLWEASAAPTDQVGALPRGVYIPFEKLRGIVDETNLIRGAAPLGNGHAAIIINRNPRVRPSVVEMILDGFEPVLRRRRRRVSTRATVAPKPLRPQDEDRLEVQSIGRCLWAGNERMSISGALKRRELAAYVRVWAENTLRGWLSQVDPRRAESKPGRRHRKPAD